MLLFKDKVTTGAYSLALFIWNVALAVATVAGTRLAPTTAVFFWHYTIFGPSQVKLCFTVNQRKIERYLEITKIF